MWIHILIFMVILGVFLAGKMGRLPPEAGNPEEKKLFIRIALTGNIIGMLLTFQSGGDKVYSSNISLPPGIFRIHPDTVWKKRRQVLMKRNSKYL